jgi:hypothetical protein
VARQQRLHAGAPDHEAQHRSDALKAQQVFNNEKPKDFKQ